MTTFCLLHGLMSEVDGHVAIVGHSMGSDYAAVLATLVDDPTVVHLCPRLGGPLHGARAARSRADRAARRPLPGARSAARLTDVLDGLAR
jgi:hypothetical protein